MARITQDDFSGHSTANNENKIEIDASGQENIKAPHTKFISDSDLSRDGQDLILEAPDGQVLTIQNYFSEENSPLIEAPDGSILTGDLINSFLKSSPQYAQAESLNDLSPIGAVEEITGDAKVTRTDGTSENLSLGSPIYKGDIIETTGKGAVNISFIDETSMAVSENARLSVDEYQYDPSTESGETNLSVLRGVFVFTSGLIGRDDPDDVRIDTPVGSIGIRGTVIAGQINPGGESQITVVEGAIVVTNGVMETTLSKQYESVRLGGFNDNMQDIGVQDAAIVGKTYGSVSDVVPKLFSSINDNIKQESIVEKASEQSPEEVLESSEEILDQDLSLDESEADTDSLNNELLDFESLTSGTENPNILPLNKELLENSENPEKLVRELRERYQEDTLLNPELFQPEELRLTGSGFKLFEGTNNGDTVARFFASGGSQGPVSFTFANGLTTSADGNFQIVQTDGRRIEIQLTSAGESNLDVTTAGTLIGTPFALIATDSEGKQQNLSFNPTVLDAAVHLNTAGGLDFGVSSGINLGPNKIGDFNGDGTSDYFTVPDSSTVSINGIDIPNVISGSTLNTVSGIGDVNNDGYDDFIYGAPDAGNGFVNLVTGNNAFDTSSPTAIATGTNTGDKLGYAVAGIGDFDGDGKSDFAYSAINESSTGPNRGKLYFEFGDGTSSSIDGHSDNMNLGNRIDGLGDVNGDGLSDVIVSAQNQIGGNYEAYIINGGSAPTNTSTGVTTISTPYEIVAGGSAGDLNGDGFDDIAISLKMAMGADINTFVIFGQNSLPTTIDMAYLENPDNALKIHHAGAGSASEYQVTSLGDLNGDGFGEIQVGIVGGQQFIVHGNIAGDGIPYVTDNSASDGDGNLGRIGATSNGQSLVGDTHFMDNNHTDLSMIGGAGRNDFSLNNTNFKNIDGGAGVTDTIRYGTNGGTLDFSAVNFEQVSQIERFHFSQDGATIQLTSENIFNMLKTSENGSLTIELGSSGGTAATTGTLLIDAAANHSDDPAGVIAALTENGNGIGTTHVGTANGYDHFEIGGYDLYIDTDVTTQVI